MSCKTWKHEGNAHVAALRAGARLAPVPLSVAPEHPSSTRNTHTGHSGTHLSVLQLRGLPCQGALQLAHLQAQVLCLRACLRAGGFTARRSAAAAENTAVQGLPRRCQLGARMLTRTSFTESICFSINSLSASVGCATPGACTSTAPAPAPPLPPPCSSISRLLLLRAARSSSSSARCLLLRSCRQMT